MFIPDQQSSQPVSAAVEIRPEKPSYEPASVHGQLDADNDDHIGQRSNKIRNLMIVFAFLLISGVGLLVGIGVILSHRPKNQDVAIKPAEKNDGGKRGREDNEPVKEKASTHPRTIRISGIHKPGGGDIGFLTVNDRSDIDLWIDNPVEADAKWKDKNVEVEMLTDDLRIVNNQNLAFLTTPQHKPWSMRGGWQEAAFVFRDVKRKQLIGFQNLDGTVVIRGVCRGLDRGRVTFDPCEIIQKPNEYKEKERKKEKEKPILKGPAGFDSNDLERTLKWVLACAAKLRTEEGNQIRFREVLNEMEAELPNHAGKTVRWTLKVQAISEKAVVVSSTYVSGRVGPGILGATMATLNPHLVLDNGTTKFRELHLEVGSEISREKARKLRPGDELVATGKVVKVTMEETKSPNLLGFHVKVKLSDLRAE